MSNTTKDWGGMTDELRKKLRAHLHPILGIDMKATEMELESILPTVDESDIIKAKAIRKRL